MYVRRIKQAKNICNFNSSAIHTASIIKFCDGKLLSHSKRIFELFCVSLYSWSWLHCVLNSLKNNDINKWIIEGKDDDDDVEEVSFYFISQTTLLYN